MKPWGTEKLLLNVVAPGLRGEDCVPVTPSGPLLSGSSSDTRHVCAGRAPWLSLARAHSMCGRLQQSWMLAESWGRLTWLSAASGFHCREAGPGHL